MGIAHDGDSDRCQAVDEQGNLVDGDQIMAILALAAHRAGHLSQNTLVATVMSSLGLELYLREHGISLVRTAVGDRYVLEEMREHGYNLGGEQSGHVIMSDYATTGDGVLTGIQLAAEVARSGEKLSVLASRMQPTPQRLINVKGVDRAGVSTNAALNAAVADAENGLGRAGVFFCVLLEPNRWYALWLRPLRRSRPILLLSILRMWWRKNWLSSLTGFLENCDAYRWRNISISPTIRILFIAQVQLISADLFELKNTVGRIQIRMRPTAFVE